MVISNYFQTANKLKQEGKLEESVTSYKQAIQTNHKFYWCYHNLAEVLSQLDRWDEASTFYQRALELNPNSAWSHYNYGGVLIQLGRINEAITSYRRAIDLNPKNHIFYNKLGKTFYQLATQLNPESLPLDQLHEIIPKPGHNKKLATDLYYLNDEEFLQATDQLTNEAFITKVYRDYLKREPDNEGKNYYLQHLDNGMTRQEIIAGFRQAPEFRSLFFSLIVSFCLLEAISAYRKAAELSPNSPKSYQNLGEALNQFGNVLQQQGKLDEAIDNYQEAITVYHNFAWLHDNHGKELSPLGKLHEAIKTNQQVKVTSDNLAWAYYTLGNSFSQQGQLDHAIESYNKALFIKEDFPNPHLGLGNALLLADKSEEGIESFKRAIALEPSWAEAHYNLGSEFLQQNKLEEALASFKQVIALKPSWAEAHAMLGNTFLQQGKYQEALDAHKTALSLKRDWDPWAYFACTIIPLFYQDCRDGMRLICEQALTLKPDWFEGYYEAGNWLFHCGYEDMALEFWSKGVNLQSKVAKANHIDTQGFRFWGTDFTRNIGHICLLDFHIKMDILGWRSLGNKSVIGTPSKQLVANQCLLNYWQSYIPIISNPSEYPDLAPLVKYAEERISTVTLSNHRTVYYFHALATVQKQWEAEGRLPLLSLSESDSDRGWRCLHSLGVPANAWFVCLHVREPRLLEKLIIGSSRNADIDTYLLAIKSIVARGGWVIRMGDRNMKQLPPMPQVIDYAHSEVKSDWMDVFLFSQCRFFIGTNSGPNLVPPCFGVPCVLTNWVPLLTSPIFGNSIFIPKLFWSELKNRYLTFGEAMSIPLVAGEYKKYYSVKGIRVNNNTSEEINDVVIEMLERLDGRLEYEKPDESLQNQWRALIETHGSYAGSRIGLAFLRKYAVLLYDEEKIAGTKSTQLSKPPERTWLHKIY